jgi:hypothetical protein
MASMGRRGDCKGQRPIFGTLKMELLRRRVFEDRLAGNGSVHQCLYFSGNFSWVPSFTRAAKSNGL